MDNKGVADFISIVFFADKFEDLPICQRVGDIIRVHRATVATYKDRKQLTANVCFNSSWALFPLHFKGERTEGVRPNLSDEFTPTIFFGKSVQVEKEEHSILRNIRKWAITSFESKPVLTIWHAQVYNNKYKFLREGSYVRIRGCTLLHFSNKGYERTFGLRPFSNILTLPYPSKLA